MTSQRHSPQDRVDVPEAATGREVPAQVLDATRATVLAVGVRRTTLTDVARRAGVRRMTLYRLVPDVTTLILEVMSRDFAALLAAAETDARRRPTARTPTAATTPARGRRRHAEP